MTRIGTVRKIAVVRASGIGDFIFGLPAFEALRRRFPGAEIVLLGKPWHRAFLTGRPGPVDRVIALPPIRGVGAPEDADEDADELERLFAALRAEAFDLAIQMHGGGRWSNPFVRRLGAGRTLGLRAAGAEALDANVPYLHYQPEVFRCLEVVELAGARATEWEPRFPVTDADHAAAAAILPAGRPVAVLHPGATDPRRRWPIESFAAVADALADAGAAVAVNAMGDERPLIDALARRMRHPVIDLGADCTLSCLTGVLARAALTLGNDSGPLHLARAVGTATVGLFWCGNAINAAATSRTRHRPLISWQLHCPQCGIDSTRLRCPHDPSFVADIDPREAIEHALDLLAAETCDAERRDTGPARPAPNAAPAAGAARPGAGAA